MPLNRPALSLGVGPRGVRDARTWVHQVCSEIGRDDLLECAALGVSELVTNALLHAAPPIQVQVRGTVDHPRIEVRDGSTRPPTLPTDANSLSVDPDALTDDLDEVLLTFGRGLDMVARASVAWGAEVEEDGKVLWFEPTSVLAEDAGTAGVLTDPRRDLEDELADSGTGATTDLVDVDLLHVPVRAHLSFQRHYRELRRELRLLSLAHEADYPHAKNLSDLFGSLEGRLRRDLATDQVETARRESAEHVDLSVRLSSARVVRVRQLSELLDLADDFCREQRLLVLGRTAEQVRFQQWLLGQYVDQAAGLPAQPWVDASEATDTGIRHTNVS
ncbi:ATP-binding protein [Nocardioides salsibiostraticola]